MILNYIRYFIVVLLLGSLFFTQSIELDGNKLYDKVLEKLPIEKEKNGFTAIITDIEVIDINEKGYIESLVSVDAISPGVSLFGKTITSKTIHLKVQTLSKPKIKNGEIYFDVSKISVNDLIKINKIKGIVRTLMESIKLKNKKLEELGSFINIRNVSIIGDRDEFNILVKFGIVLWIYFLIIPLLLLREIGILLISFYQKFLSPKKGYRCAKGALHGGDTCSSSVKKEFEKTGFYGGMKEYFRSTKECKVAHKTIKENRDNTNHSCIDGAVCSGLEFSSCSGSSSAGLGECGAGGCGAGSCDIGSC